MGTCPRAVGHTGELRLLCCAGMASANSSGSQERQQGKENRRLEVQKHLRCHFASRINPQASAGSGEDWAEKLCIWNNKSVGCLLLKFHNQYGLMGLLLYTVVEMTWHMVSPLHRYMVRMSDMLIQHKVCCCPVQSSQEIRNSCINTAKKDNTISEFPYSVTNKQWYILQPARCWLNEQTFQYRTLKLVYSKGSECQDWDHPWRRSGLSQEFLLRCITANSKCCSNTESCPRPFQIL